MELLGARHPNRRTKKRNSVMWTWKTRFVSHPLLKENPVEVDCERKPDPSHIVPCFPLLPFQNLGYSHQDVSDEPLRMCPIGTVERSMA